MAYKAVGPKKKCPIFLLSSVQWQYFFMTYMIIYQAFKLFLGEFDWDLIIRLPVYFIYEGKRNYLFNPKSKQNYFSNIFLLMEINLFI